MRSPARRPDDSAFAADLRAVTPRPVFIIGLHRSGTTFLYQTLAAVFPVAALTAYHVVNYDRILRDHREGSADAARTELDATFRSWGMTTRRIDDVPLSHAMVEEYGWVLRRRTGSFSVNQRTAPLLDEICRKLQLVTPSAQAVLQKNPWDTGRVASLLAHFPEARFIFMRRDPLAIANSQFRIAKYFGGERDPYVNLLLRGIPLGRAWMGLQRTLRRVAGARLHGRIARRYILADISRELRRLEDSWNMTPPGRRLGLDYDGLVGDQRGSLEKAGAFLRLEPRPDAVVEEPRPRRLALLPEVAAVEAGFRRRLKDKGLGRPLGAA